MENKKTQTETVNGSSLPTGRVSGVLSHPSSFPGQYGIGDFGPAAYSFIDFLYKANQTIWQILPLCPTSFGDSPYQSFSTFAGNPLFISPELLIEEGLLTESDCSDIPDFDPLAVDYGPVINYKDGLYRKAYSNFIKSNDKKQKTAFDKFCSENKNWLDDFCLFTALKAFYINKRKDDLGSEEYLEFSKNVKKFLNENQTNDYYYGAVWQSWPKEIANRDKTAIKRKTSELADEIVYYKYLQFLFFKQWLDLKKYANKKHITIIGDIPIFVALDSSDVWSRPEMFSLDENGYPLQVAGVPPDYFSETGQLWGNPLYDWKRHKEEGYEWWINRLESAIKITDLVRIDHFRGFESYWAIPSGEKTAVKGKWLAGPGKDLFIKLRERLGALPIIAEDLGIITKKVEKLRDDLGLPGMKILQFGFDGQKDNSNIPHNYKTSNTVVYTGTHDNDTTVGWYESTTDEIRDRFRRYSNVSGNEPAWDMIRTAFLSCADYAIIPIQDVLSLPSDARMNFPGKAGGNWRFRYDKDSLTDELAVNLKYLADLSDRNKFDYTDTEEICK